DFKSNTIEVQTNANRDETVNKTILLQPIPCKQLITGVVLDEKTNSPIESASVKLVSSNQTIATKTSDASGKFSFEVACNENYSIEVTKSDFKSNTIEVQTNANRDETVNKTILLQPIPCNQLITGVVLDKKSNSPIENAILTLTDKTGNTITTRQSNELGKYTFNVNCNSNYIIKAEKNNYSGNELSIATTEKNSYKNSSTLFLTKKDCNQQVTGIIRDKISKKPLANSTITLYQDKKIINHQEVGEDGKYTFDLKCETTYKLSVFKNNKVISYRIKTAVQDGRVLYLNFDIEPAKCEQFVNGSVSESITNNAIPNADILLNYNSQTISKTITDSNGSFYFKIDCNKNYEILANKNNYIPSKKQLQSKDKIGHPYQVNIKLSPIVKFKIKNGKKYIDTKTINFDLDEYELSNEAKIELNKVVYNMKQNPTIKIAIYYYTDSKGPDQYNLELTQKRADASKDYIVSKGIDPSRIIAKGFGETVLVNRCKNGVKCTEAEHAQNRRTEFLVLPN
ncbi:MAG: carboxypeptidase regulatory-like domain-containing protein, partial [Lutibacter sp.]